MMKCFAKMVLVIGLIFVSGTMLFAKTLESTKLEKLLNSKERGIVINSEEFAKIEGGWGSIRIELFKALDLGESRQALGLKIIVLKSKDSIYGKGVFIDAEEIDSFLNGLRNIGRIDPSELPFSDYQAHYITRGHLVVSREKNTRGEERIYFRSGIVNADSAAFEISSLMEIQNQIRKAQRKLESLKTK